MKRRVSFAIIFLFAFCSLGWAQDVYFQNCKLANANGTQIKAILTFSDSRKEVVIQVKGRNLASIPYANLDKVTYEYTRKHRLTTGAILMAFTPFGAGGLVMLTKSKRNWLYIDFHDRSGKQTIVMKLEKEEVPGILNAFKNHTGKTVVRLGDASKA